MANNTLKTLKQSAQGHHIIKELQVSLAVLEGNQSTRTHIEMEPKPSVELQGRQSTAGTALGFSS